MAFIESFESRIESIVLRTLEGSDLSENERRMAASAIPIALAVVMTRRRSFSKLEREKQREVVRDFEESIAVFKEAAIGLGYEL